MKLRARGAADFFAARDFLAGAPRRPARARPPTVRGESSGPKSSKPPPISS